MDIAEHSHIDIVLVDDHTALRKGFAVLLERRGCHVVGSTSRAADVPALVAEHLPDVVVVDLGLPDEPGIALVRRLLAKRPDLRIVIYTGLEDAAVLGEALECGALGVMLKGSPITEVLDALRAARRGERYVDSRLATLLEDREDLPAILTKREREVFDLLAGGLTGEEIAVRLVLSPETVRTHVRNAMRKLEARTRTEAVVQAIERREIEPHPRVAAET